MVYERVEMEVLPFSWAADPKILTEEILNTYPENHIRVIAWFVMQNTGSNEEKMQAVFPLGSFNQCGESDPGMIVSYNNERFRIEKDSFIVQVDSTPLTTTQVTTPHPACEDYTMDWAAFNVTFPLHREVLIRVEYNLIGNYGDAIQNIEYVLETGAAWKGPIGRGHIIFRFPQVVSREQIFDEISPGYQILYNEIFWSFENLEPTRQDNILVSIVAPPTWLAIEEARSRIKVDRTDVEAWQMLAKNYFDIAQYSKRNYRDEYYHQKVFDTYQLALASNPDSADLNADYADFLLGECCYWYPDTPAPGWDVINRIMTLLEKALQADPSHPKALEGLKFVREMVPELTYIPPRLLRPRSLRPHNHTISYTDKMGRPHSYADAHRNENKFSDVYSSTIQNKHQHQRAHVNQYGGYASA